MTISVQTNYEGLIEAAWIAVMAGTPGLTANLGTISGAPAVGAWREYQQIGADGYPYAYAHCSGVQRGEEIGNDLVANPGFVNLGIVTLAHDDPDGQICASLLGVLSDLVSLSDIVARLNAAQPRLYVYPRGISLIGQSAHDVTTTHHSRAFLTAARFTATA